MDFTPRSLTSIHKEYFQIVPYDMLVLFYTVAAGIIGFDQTLKRPFNESPSFTLWQNFSFTEADMSGRKGL